MNAAFIPVRGGSKSIPLKNIKAIAGKPLVYWAVRAACGCSEIDKVYIATDSSEIRKTVESFIDSPEKKLLKKAEVIGRSAESAQDTASTETAMLEFAERYEFDNIILIQATSPLLTAKDLDRGLKAFHEAGTDSVLSVVRQKRFLWNDSGDKYAKPLNYDIYSRPRRQESDGFLVENGAFYITSKEALLNSKSRISGSIRAVEMTQDSYFEIDEPEDWMIIEELMKKHRQADADCELRMRAKNIRLFLTDCDGCLTDGGMYYSEHGDELKKFHTHDGMAFKLLRERGILTGILTGENVNLNRRRAEKLNLDILESGCLDKAAALRRICRERNISLEQTVYIGDDINDLEAVRLAGIGCCPADAVSGIKEAADMTAAARGGRGAVREIADFILKWSV